MRALAILFLILTGLSLSAQDSPSRFQEANQAYLDGDFEAAILGYQDILTEDGKSASLYYNLGNAYYKSGQTARAILNYERALKLSPHDDDIRQNLEVARESVIDRFESVPQPLFKAFYQNLFQALQPDSWAWLSVAFGLILMAAVGIYLFSNQKRSGFGVAIAALLLALFSWFMAAQHHSYQEHNQAAIVMATNSYVKSGPGEKAEDVFILHAGTKAMVQESYDGWSKIKLPDGKIGWIHSGDLEVI